MSKTKWRLPDKRVVEQHGSKWIVYPSTGFVEFTGSAEECWDYLIKKGILPDDEREEKNGA